MSRKDSNRGKFDYLEYVKNLSNQENEQRFQDYETALRNIGLKENIELDDIKNLFLLDLKKAQTRLSEQKPGTQEHEYLNQIVNMLSEVVKNWEQDRLSSVLFLSIEMGITAARGFHDRVMIFVRILETLVDNPLYITDDILQTMEAFDKAIALVDLQLALAMGSKDKTYSFIGDALFVANKALYYNQIVDTSRYLDPAEDRDYLQMINAVKQRYLHAKEDFILKSSQRSATKDSSEETFEDQQITAAAVKELVEHELKVVRNGSRGSDEDVHSISGLQEMINNFETDRVELLSHLINGLIESISNADEKDVWMYDQSIQVILNEPLFPQLEGEKLRMAYKAAIRWRTQLRSDLQDRYLKSTKRGALTEIQFLKEGLQGQNVLLAALAYSQAVHASPEKNAQREVSLRNAYVAEMRKLYEFMGNETGLKYIEQRENKNTFGKKMGGDLLM